LILAVRTLDPTNARSLRDFTFIANAPTLLQTALKQFSEIFIIGASSARGRFTFLEFRAIRAQIRATGRIRWWHAFETSCAGINIPAIISNAQEIFKGLIKARNILCIVRGPPPDRPLEDVNDELGANAIGIGRLGKRMIGMDVTHHRRKSGREKE
jgi:hypothetical protein